MLGVGLIVFRETLEAALFVGVVAAATRCVMDRTRWLALGVGLGLLGSLIMAAAMEQISQWAQGLGQDVVNAAILSIALLMLAWHTVWVSAHGQEMTEAARRLGAETTQGSGSLWAVALAVAMTVLREGAEIVLFVAGLLTGNAGDMATWMMEVILGLALGALIGWLIYSGLGQLQPRRLFRMTQVLILMLAGNMASQLARTLQQADWMNVLGANAWDVTSWLSNDSWPGMLLHGLVGYDASPSQLQVLCYVLTTLLVGFAARQMRLRTTRA